MKNIIWIVLALLAMSLIIPEMRCESRNAEEISKDEDRTSVENEAAGNDVDETEDVTEYDDEPYMDTLLIVDGKALGFMETDDYMKCAVAYDLQPIMDDPTTSFDSISPMVYAIDLVGRRQNFNVSYASCVEKMKAFNRPIRGFKRYDRKFEMAPDSAASMNYFFTLDYPDESVGWRDEISKWLAGLVDGSQVMDVEVKSYTSLYIGYHPTSDYGARYKGSPTDLDKLSAYASKMWWASMKAEFDGDYPFTLYFIADYRARICNERFVTYRKYIHSYLGGAHGMYTENLLSYDLINHRPINNEYLFRDGMLDKVTYLLFEAIAKNEKFRSWNEGVETAEDVKSRIEGWNDEDIMGETGTFRLPQAGLTDEGLVFSFQPYEIDCFAAGCFHILVSYDKIKPYMNKQVVKMLGI